MSKSFYADLPSLNHYAQMVDPAGYQDLPLDWVVVLTDVKNSTKAIEDGRYKEVNMIGVSTIVAVQNALKDLQFPFIFGGDGATLAVPASELETVKRALCQTRALAQERFALTLRIAVIPAIDIVKTGAQLKVAKMRISAQHDLAMVRGDGWTLGETWMKEREGDFTLPINPDAAADFAGLECRWNPLPARKDEIMALIIQARVAGPRAAQIYRQILDEILGPELRPISLGELNLRFPPKYLMAEAKMRVRGGLRRALYYAGQSMKLFLQVIYMTLRGRRRNLEEPVEYLRELSENTDYLKFDECLRMVVDVSREQKARLLQQLESHVERGEIFYGFHCDPCALLTCYIQGPHKHIHFVDAAGGGYAMAAKKLKADRKRHLESFPAPARAAR